MAQLVVHDPDGQPITHELGAGIHTIGRDTDNAVIIPDSSVSRHHAEIAGHGETWTLRDLDSANGTTINGEGVTLTTLTNGAVIHFGTRQTTFRWEPRVESAPAEPAAPVGGRRFGTRSVLIGVGACLVAALAVGTLARQPGRVRPEPGRTPVATPNPQGKATKAFWDQIQRIESRGNEHAHQLGLEQYPRFADGMYNFGGFADEDFGTLLDKIKDRAQTEVRVAEELAAIDQRGVDADLLAYTSELGAQWRGGAAVDEGFGQMISVLHEQRQRFTGPDAVAVRSFAATSGENRLDDEYQKNQADIRRLGEQWTVQKDAHLADTAKILAREKETNRLLTGRYGVKFE